MNSFLEIKTTQRVWYSAKFKIVSQFYQNFVAPVCKTVSKAIQCSYPKGVFIIIINVEIANFVMLYNNCCC